MPSSLPFPPRSSPPLAAFLFGQVPGLSGFTSDAPKDAFNLQRARAVRVSKLLEFMVASDKYGLALIKTEEEARVLLGLLLSCKQPLLLEGCDKVRQPSGHSLKHDKAAVFFVTRAADAEYMLWRYEGSVTWRNIQLALLVLAVICCNMYTLWPNWARNAVWWVSVSMLLFILGTIVLQLILFIIVWPTGWDFWLLPNFTSEEAPIWMLFKPLYTLQRNPGGHPALRVATVALLGAAVYMLTTLPPSEFQEFLNSQKKIVDDLYSGALLTDGKEGGSGLVAGGKFENPMSPFGSKWGPGSGRYGSARAVPIPSLDEVRFCDWRGGGGSFRLKIPPPFIYPSHRPLIHTTPPHPAPFFLRYEQVEKMAAETEDKAVEGQVLDDAEAVPDAAEGGSEGDATEGEATGEAGAVEAEEAGGEPQEATEGA